MAKSGPLLAITGGTGFVGSHVISAALERGYRVRALVRHPNKVEIGHTNLEWHEGALGVDDQKFVTGVDGVIHIAGLIKARTLSEFMAVNAAAAGKLAEAAQARGVPRFMLMSSQVAREPQLSGYARSKQAGEEAVKAAFHGSSTIIRAPAVFGPGDQATAPFFSFIQKGLLPVPGGQGWDKRRISMAYVEDLAGYMLDIAADPDFDGQTLNPASLLDINWPDFAKLCAQAAGRPVKAVPLPLALLYPVAQVTSLTSRLFGVGHLTREKLGEFLHADWSSEQLIPDATAPIDALVKTLRSYAK